METGGWSAYEKMVLNRLESLEAQIEDLRAEVVGTRIDVATLKVKAGIWGAAAGCIPALVAGAAVFLGGGGA